jgi:hypothetical protein
MLPRRFTAILFIGNMVSSSECWPIIYTILLGYIDTPLNFPSPQPVSNVFSSNLNIASTELVCPIKRSEQSPNQSHLNISKGPSPVLVTYTLKKYLKFTTNF